MGKKAKKEDELTNYQECCVCTRKTSRNFQNVTQFYRKKQKLEKVDDEYLTIFDILESLRLLNYEIIDVENTMICNHCKKTVLDFFDFKVMTEKQQEENKSTFKSTDQNVQIDSVKKYLRSDHYDTLKNFIVKNPIESIEENDQNELTIRPLKIKLEEVESFFPEFDFNSAEVVVKLEKSDDVELAFCDNDDASETNQRNEFIDEEDGPSDRDDTFNFDDSKNELGVTKIVIDNVEFISRVPECMAICEKKKKEKEKNIQTNMQNPENWLRIKQRQARVNGKSYVSKNGKLVRAKEIKEPCNSSCRFKCTERISDFDRRKNFENHWSIGDFALQKKFLFEHRKTEPVARRRARYENSRPRAYSTKYYLDTFNEDGTFKAQEKVCETMFCSTFDICKNNLRTLYKKVITGKVQDMRGQAPRKLSPAYLIAIDHVKKFPYFHIEQNMTVTQIYKLYVQECTEKGIEDVIREATYRKIFSDYNECDFLKQDRRKAQCEFCFEYEKASDEEKVLRQSKFEHHISTNDQCKQRLRWRKIRKRKVERRKLLKEQKVIQKQHEQHKSDAMNQHLTENYGTDMELF